MSILVDETDPLEALLSRMETLSLSLQKYMYTYVIYVFLDDANKDRFSRLLKWLMMKQCASLPSCVSPRSSLVLHDPWSVTIQSRHLSSASPLLVDHYVLLSYYASIHASWTQSVFINSHFLSRWLWIRIATHRVIALYIYLWHAWSSRRSYHHITLE